MGEYIGNGSTDGPFINTGFRPALIIFKNLNAGEEWVMYNNKVNPYNVVDAKLYPSGNYAEASTSNTNDDMDFCSNGFKIRGSEAEINTSGHRIFYMAFAEDPLKFGNAR